MVDEVHKPSCPFCIADQDVKTSRLRHTKESYFKGVELSKAAGGSGFDLSDILVEKDREAWAIARELYRIGRFDQAKAAILEGVPVEAKLFRYCLMLEEIVATKLTTGLADPAGMRPLDLHYLIKTLNELTILRQKTATAAPAVSSALRALESEPIDDTDNLEVAG